ncbi:MAG: type II toxin-antitoxin system PemK/MazF family toxin [bacterium]|nr:type II toxin-antitoxin system PemK/MazF family toxin [bacterium]
MANRGRLAKKKEVDWPRRGEIYSVRFDPTVGHEIQKTRPAVVIQNNVSNQYSPITIVAAISSKFSDPPFPREVVIEPEVSGLPMRSAVVLNQIRSVGRARLSRRLGTLSPKTMQRIDEALRISLGLVDLDEGLR